jgi:hypothetical protein
MSLAELQRAFMELITQPLTAADGMQERTADGRSMAALAESIIKPSARLTSFERAELYNTGYWFRILSALADDFPGLCAIIGPRAFDAMSAAYLAECPPPFDLRDLGARLATWLADHPGHAAGRERLARDMVRLEWAEIEVSDRAEWPKLAADDLARLGEGMTMRLPPHLRLLDLSYPVDAFLLAIRGRDKERGDIVSNAMAERRPRNAKARRVAPPKPQPVHLAVHRHDGVVHYKRLEPQAFALLRRLQQGEPLAEAIEVVLAASSDGAEEMTAQLQRWFEEWSSLGWFCREPDRDETEN